MKSPWNRSCATRALNSFIWLLWIAREKGLIPVTNKEVLGKSTVDASVAKLAPCLKSEPRARRYGLNNGKPSARAVDQVITVNISRCRCSSKAVSLLVSQRLDSAVAGFGAGARNFWEEHSNVDKQKVREVPTRNKK